MQSTIKICLLINTKDFIFGGPLENEDKEGTRPTKLGIPLAHMLFYIIC
jgi:hypothetical protein